MNGQMRMAVLVGASFLVTPALAESQDERAVDELMKQWLAAHDAGDAAGLAKFYVSDADYVGIDGRTVKGRDAIIGMYTQIFAFTKGNKAKIARKSRRVLGDSVVVDDGAWEVIGELPPGAPKKGLYTTVFARRDGGWRIVAARSYVPWAGPTAKND